MSFNIAAIRSELESALASHDRAAFTRAALQSVDDGLEIEDLYQLVLTPLLVDLGERWSEGATRVWEEHFASSCVRTVVEALHLKVAEKAGGNTEPKSSVLLACPPGEQHDLGMRMLADRMQLAGWNAYFLGADTPVEEIIAAAQILGVDLIALSAATHYNRLLLRTVIDRLKDALPGVRIGIGGPAFVGDTEWPTDEILTDCNLGIIHDGTCEL